MIDFLCVADRLSLHHLTALDAPAADLAAMAGALGCAHVCLFTYVPPAVRHLYPLVAPGEVPALGAALAQAGVTLCNLEVFPLDSAPDWSGFEAGLATGAALGATRATAHVHDADAPEAARRFGRFCDMAAGFGIEAGLEFNPFSAISTLPAAATVIRAADRANGSLVCDMLHLFRGGGSVRDIAAAADLIGYAQFCDGPRDMPAERRWQEAIRERLPPGAGAFPLADALRALRPSTVLEVEVPQTAARKAGEPPIERARRAVEAMRRLISPSAPPENVP